MGKYVIIACLFLLMVGCGCAESNSILPQNKRIQVSSEQIFRDAGGHYRNILVLKDSESGKEYLVVMGAGITDMSRGEE